MPKNLWLLSELIRVAVQIEDTQSNYIPVNVLNGSSLNAGSGSGCLFFPIFFVIRLYCYFRMFGIFPSFMVEISKKTRRSIKAYTGLPVVRVTQKQKKRLPKAEDGVVIFNTLMTLHTAAYHQVFLMKESQLSLCSLSYILITLKRL